MNPFRIRFNEAWVLPIDDRPVPATDADSYQRLEKRSHRQVWTDRADARKVHGKASTVSTRCWQLALPLTVS